MGNREKIELEARRKSLFVLTPSEQAKLLIEVWRRWPLTMCWSEKLEEAVR